MTERNKKSIIPVIVAGGRGTRLWPISTGAKPKQFCNLIGTETLFQSALKRMQNTPFALDPIVVCNKKHVDLVKQQSSQINAELMKIILEPFGKNTAPAITLAALSVGNLSITETDDQSENDPVLLVLPADHAIGDLEAFNQSINTAYNFVSVGDHIVCFGVIPSHPETGYGYIQAGEPCLKNNEFLKVKAHVVDRFVEKPNYELAKQYIQSGQYFWNSGMLMFRRSVFLREMQHYAADIYLSCEEILKKSVFKSNLVDLSEDKLSLCRNESIDRAMMEHTNNAIVVTLNARWSDLGTFASLENYLQFIQD